MLVCSLRASCTQVLSSPIAPALPAGAITLGWTVWGFAAGLYFVAVFHRMVLGVAAFEAERRYHVGAGALSAFTAVQLGVYLAMQVPVGLAADRIGPRRSLAAGMAAIAVGEAIFALSGTLRPGSRAARSSASATRSCSSTCCASRTRGSSRAARRCSRR